MIDTSRTARIGTAKTDAGTPEWLPIVATRVGGIPEIVADGVNGILVPPEDPEQLRLALLRLADDRGLAEPMGEEGCAMVRVYSADRIAERYLDVYRPFLGASLAVPDQGNARDDP